MVFISNVAYTVAAYKYKYRQRNELSDVNERVVIAEYTEIQIDQIYDKEDEDDDDSDSDITTDDVKLFAAFSYTMDCMNNSMSITDYIVYV